MATMSPGEFKTWIDVNEKKKMFLKKSEPCHESVKR